MPELARGTNPSMSSPDPSPDNFMTGTAGEAIGVCDQVYLNANGRWYRATGAAANAAARVRGQARFAADVGEPVTVSRRQRYRYFDTAQTIGIDVFVSGTVPGGLADTAPAGAPAPIGYVLDDGLRVQFFDPR